MVPQEPPEAKRKGAGFRVDLLSIYRILIKEVHTLSMSYVNSYEVMRYFLRKMRPSATLRWLSCNPAVVVVQPCGGFSPHLFK